MKLQIKRLSQMSKEEISRAVGILVELTGNVKLWNGHYISPKGTLEKYQGAPFTFESVPGFAKVAFVE